ncbi:TM2 domain-containing protein CG10795-like [Artemia franciscana]|uniref:TM2 domain-containing protein CG10795-like n=1 Tax=Artemia franciscana TaxID=6661 RepID=UPI0032DB8E42
MWFNECLCLFPMVSLVLGDFNQSKNYVDCNNLNLGQYICDPPIIDDKSQQPIGCNENGKAKIFCNAADGLICSLSDNSTFEMEIPCRWTNGYSFEKALLLSVFLGTFGIDRFYLGYPAIGLLKLFTCGFMFVGQLIDVILIATQTLGPADGSAYVISYYGQVLEILQINDETYRYPQEDWFS